MTEVRMKQIIHILVLIALNLVNFVNPHELQVHVYVDQDAHLTFDTSVQESSPYHITFNGKRIFENATLIDGALQKGQAARFMLHDYRNGSVSLEVHIKQVQDVDNGLYQLWGTSAVGEKFVENITLLVIQSPQDLRCTANGTYFDLCFWRPTI